MKRMKYERLYTPEQKEWLRNNAHNYKTIREITNAFNERYGMEERIELIRSRLEVLFGTEYLKKWNSKKRTTIADKDKPTITLDLKEKAKEFKPDGMKWVKNYPNFALYEKTLPTGDTIRSCYNYIETRWFL